MTFACLVHLWLHNSPFCQCSSAALVDLLWCTPIFINRDVVCAFVVAVASPLRHKGIPVDEAKGGRRMWASTFHPCHVATRLCLREPEWIWIGCNTVQNIYCSRVRFMENWAFIEVDGGGVKAKDSHHLLFTRNGRVSYSFSFPSVPPAIEMGFLRITNAFQGRIKYQTPLHVIWPSVTNHHHHRK